MSETTTAVVDDDDDLPVLPDIAGFEGYLFATAWRLEEDGKRVQMPVAVKLRCGVYGDGNGGGFLEYINPHVDRGVSDFLPPRTAAMIASALFEQEWRMWDSVSPE